MTLLKAWVARVMGQYGGAPLSSEQGQSASVVSGSSWPGLLDGWAGEGDAFASWAGVMVGSELEAPRWTWVVAPDDQ